MARPDELDDDGSEEAPTRAGWQPLAIAVVATTLGVLPSFLMGTLAVSIREDFAFGESRLGVLITVYSLTSAVVSTPMGRVVERVGASGGMRISALSGAVAMGGIGLVADSYAAIVAFFLLGGIGHAAVHPAANLAIVRRVQARRQGLAFGIKQASIPAATFIGGLAVPLGQSALGWRSAFVMGAAASLVVAAVAGRAATAAPPPMTREASAFRTGPLVVLAVGAALTVGAVQPLGAFFISYAASVGTSASLAGTLLAGASLTGIAVRIGSGAFAGTRDPSRLLLVVSGFIVLGASGVWLLGSATSSVALGVGMFVGVAIGWSWNAMFHYSVVRSHAQAPAAASSITQAGVLAGGSLGPLGFGLLVEQASYQVAWTTASAIMLAGAATMLWASRVLPADRVPATPARRP